MQKKHIGVFLSILFVLSLCLDVYAMPAAVYGSSQKGLYRVAELSAEYQSKSGQALITAMALDGYKAVSPGICNVVLQEQSGPGLFVIYLGVDDLAHLTSIEKEAENYVRAVLPEIIPEGTGIDEIPIMAAGWVAQRMDYDEQAYFNPVLSKQYQNAMPCFESGMGICTTYTCAFNTIVHMVPINKETFEADYSCADPFYLETVPVLNDIHMWSGVKMPDGWREYDVCYYDTSENGEQYLTGLVIRDEGDHKDPFPYQEYFR